MMQTLVVSNTQFQQKVEAYMQKTDSHLQKIDVHMRHLENQIGQLTMVSQLEAQN